MDRPNPKFSVGERVLTESKSLPEYSGQVGEVIEARWGDAINPVTQAEKWIWLYRVSGTENPYGYWFETALRKLPDQQGQSWTELMDSLKKPSEVRA